MKKQENSIRVIAVNNPKVHSKFDIYLDFSGQLEWLMMHRHNGILYGILRNGVPLRELRRLKGYRMNHVRYLLKVIDEYLEELQSA